MTDHQGINANIMPLGGIAIAIGAMGMRAIVTSENTHTWRAHTALPQGLTMGDHGILILAETAWDAMTGAPSDAA